MIALFLAAQVALSAGQTWPPAPPPIVAPGVNGALRIKRDAADVTIGPIEVRDAYRAVETDAGVDTPRIRIRGLTATGLTRDGIRLRNAAGATIEHFELVHANAPSTAAHLPEGIAIYAGTGIVIRHGRVAGFRMPVLPGVYTNGDGIATEEATSGTITDVVAEDSGDGGFDLKGDWAVDRLTARRSFRGYRFWGRSSAGTITAEGWTNAAVWVAKGSRVHLAHLVATNATGAPVIMAAGDAELIVERCTLSVPPGTPIVKHEAAGNRVQLGDGCR